MFGIGSLLWLNKWWISQPDDAVGRRSQFLQDAASHGGLTAGFCGTGFPFSFELAQSLCAQGLSHIFLDLGINKKINIYKVGLKTAVMFFSCQTGTGRSRGNFFPFFWIFTAFQKVTEARVPGCLVTFLMTQLQIYQLWLKQHCFCDQLMYNFYLSFI